MNGILRRLLWWGQDYAFAAAHQVRAAVSRTRAESFHSGHRNPVVVIPGVFESWQFMLPMIRVLHRAGHPVYVVPVLQRNRSDVRTSARIVADHLATVKLHDAVILAHSKGGLIGKYFMLALDPGQRIRGMIAICAPFSGSRYARYLPVPSLRIFSPRDTLTLQMAKEESVNHRITSLYGLFDPHIPEGSILPGATNIQLPAAGHFRILGNRETLATVLKLVEAESP
jgi:pimeloyl-ACP methyl ester carboxylesterase